MSSKKLKSFIRYFLVLHVSEVFGLANLLLLKSIIFLGNNVPLLTLFELKHKKLQFVLIICKNKQYFKITCKILNRYF